MVESSLPASAPLDDEAPAPAAELPLDAFSDAQDHGEPSGTDSEPTKECDSDRECEESSLAAQAMGDNAADVIRRPPLPPSPNKPAAAPPGPLTFDLFAPEGEEEGSESEDHFSATPTTRAASAASPPAGPAKFDLSSGADSDAEDTDAVTGSAADNVEWTDMQDLWWTWSDGRPRPAPAAPTTSAAEAARRAAARRRVHCDGEWLVVH